MRIGGKGTPWLAHKVFPSPQAPILPKRAFFRRMKRFGDAAAFPAATVPREREKKNLPKPRKETTGYQTAKARRYGGLFCLYDKASSRKKLSPPDLCRTSRDRKTGTPAFPLRRKQTHKAQGGNYKTPDLTPAGARQTCSCYEKGTGNTSRKRSSATSRKGENAFRARAATQKDAPPECLTRAFPCPSGGRRGTVGKEKATTSPRRLILQSSAF